MQKTEDRTCSKWSNQALQPSIVYPKAWLMSRDRWRNQNDLGTLAVLACFLVWRHGSLKVQFAPTMAATWKGAWGSSNVRAQ